MLTRSYYHFMEPRRRLNILNPVLLSFTLLIALVAVSFSSSSNIHDYPQSKSDDIALKMANAMKFKTISRDHTSEIPIHYKYFDGFIEFLEKTFPLVHKHLHRDIISGYSLLYKWKGSNPDLKPIFINSHYDVVPVDESGWTVDPFGGVIKDGYVWGRGAIDNKVIVITSMEAIENLLSKSFIPERSIYLAIGHDEEIGGFNGHKKISEHVQKLGVHADMIIDEGLPLVKAGFLPGLNTTTAIIGVNEKGYIYFNITATGEPGHSSMPPAQQSPIGILAKAITAIESNPLPIPADHPYENEFLSLFTAEEMATTPFLDYMRRTTTTVAMFQAGVKPNVLPTTATAWISHRVVPGDNVDAIIERNKRLINDTRIKITIDATLPPSPYSSPAAKPYKIVKQSIQKIYGNEVTITSGLMFANSDTRHYWPVSNNIYRIMPCIVDEIGFKTIHGFDEKISITDLVNAVSFYQQLIKKFNNADQDD